MVLAWLVSLAASDLLRVFISAVIPAYLSLVALKSREGQDDRVWLSYWILYSVTELFRYYLNPVLSFVPYLNVAWSALYAWLAWSGACLIANRVTKLLKGNQGKIESALYEFDSYVWSHVNRILPIYH
eukprot:EC120075.1.p1 GENE.EC120075.1~~EC120075.1.p1  ORF type:complete len:128 (+),score=10.70 EC120075.1:112-495(+)